jgi:hypothetical protein
MKSMAQKLRILHLAILGVMIPVIASSPTQAQKSTDESVQGLTAQAREATSRGDLRAAESLLKYPRQRGHWNNSWSID